MSYDNRTLIVGKRKIEEHLYDDGIVVKVDGNTVNATFEVCVQAAANEAREYFERTGKHLPYPGNNYSYRGE